MTNIHFGRPSPQGWISFENDPYLTHTRQSIYGRCAPCLENLLRQLEEGRVTIDLGTAWECWKVVAVLPGRDSAFAALEQLEACWRGGVVRGKLGRPGQPTWAVILHASSAAERDDWLPLLRESARAVYPPAEVFVSRACSNPYQNLLGPWEKWPGRECPLLRREDRPEVIAALRRNLYGDSTGRRN